MRSSLCASILLLPLVCAEGAPAKTALGWSVRHQPERVVNGAPVLFRVTTPRGATSLTGKWLDHDLAFTYDATQKAWFGLAGASQETTPGDYPLELRTAMKV